MKKLEVRKLKPGMIVAKEIRTKRGQLIAEVGTELTSPLIARLSFYKIESVTVEDEVVSAVTVTSIDEVAEETIEASDVKDTEEPVVEQKDKPATEPTESQKEIIDAILKANKPAQKVNDVVASTYSYSQKLQQSSKFKAFQMNYTRNMEQLKVNFKAIIDGDPSVSPDLLLQETEDLFKSKTSIELFDMLHNMRGINDSVYAHSLNVALISRAIGKWLKLSKEDLNVLTIAGLLHDIGKTQIPDAILNKPGRLTPDELQLIQQHTLLGNKLLKNANLDSRIQLAALQHHERHDGSGYPRQLEGDEISKFASIIAIADVYDAMTAARSYRAPKCAFQVIAAFEEDGLSKYEPQFILTFLERIATAYQNCRVMLSDGHSASIVYINNGYLSRPIVKKSDGEIIDLSKNKNLTITSIV